MIVPVALFLSMVVRELTDPMQSPSRSLERCHDQSPEGLLGKISREHPAKKPAPIARHKRPNSTGDFRAVEIAPSVMCCAAAMRATGRLYLQREAPRCRWSLVRCRRLLV